MKSLLHLLSAALLLAVIAPDARADDDRGGDFDVVAEGGALAPLRDGLLPVVVPLAQLGVTGRTRVSRHLALSGGLSALPVPEVFALGLIGRLELLPIADSLALAGFVGGRLLIVQPVLCKNPNDAPGAHISDGGGFLGEVGIGFRTPRRGGYRFGLSASALIGPITSYEKIFEPSAFVGGLVDLVVTF